MSRTKPMTITLSKREHFRVGDEVEVGTTGGGTSRWTIAKVKGNRVMLLPVPWYRHAFGWVREQCAKLRVAWLRWR